MKKICEKLKTLIPFFVTLPALRIREIEIYPIVETIFDILPYVYIVLMFAHVIKKKQKLTLLFYFLFVAEILLLINTALHPCENNLPSCGRYSSACVSIALLIEIYRDKYKTLIKGLLPLFEIIIYINFVFLIKYYGTGFSFFGHYNNLTYYVVPAILIAYLSYKLNKLITRPIVLVIITYISIFLNNSSTTKAISVIIILVFLAELLFYKIFKAKTISTYLFTYIPIIMDTYFVFGFSGGKFKIIDFIIEKILHRSVDFTNRTTIWNMAMDFIRERPIIGYGYAGYEIAIFETNNPHNRILYYLLIGGVIGLAIFIVLNFIFAKKVDKLDGVTKMVFNAIIFGMLLSLLTEGMKFFAIYFIIYFIIYNYNQEVEEDYKDR